MGNVVILLIIAIILTLAITKIVTEKRKGVKCIGCPHSKSCSSRCEIIIEKNDNI